MEQYGLSVPDMVHKFGRAETLDDKLQSRVDAFFLRRFAGRYEDIQSG